MIKLLLLLLTVYANPRISHHHSSRHHHSTKRSSNASYQSSTGRYREVNSNSASLEHFGTIKGFPSGSVFQNYGFYINYFYYALQTTYYYHLHGDKKPCTKLSTLDSDDQEIIVGDGPSSTSNGLIRTTSFSETKTINFSGNSTFTATRLAIEFTTKRTDLGSRQDLIATVQTQSASTERDSNISNLFRRLWSEQPFINITRLEMTTGIEN